MRRSGMALLLGMISCLSLDLYAETDKSEEEHSGAILHEASWSEGISFGQGALSRRLESMVAASDNPFALIPYGQNYFIYTYTTEINRELYENAGFEDADDLLDHEAKFQLSLIFPLWRNIFGEGTALGASYTQLSLWQATNSDISSPFRETNYEPQLFINWKQNRVFAGFRLTGIDVGLNHQSNGRSEALSRSWNRVFANFAFERGDLALVVNPYLRIQEDSEDDDNPNIEDYLGNFRLYLAYRSGDLVYTSIGRYSFSGHRGSIEAGFSYPLTRNTRVYLQLFSGYGETLTDYDVNQSRIGIGLMLNDLL